MDESRKKKKTKKRTYPDLINEEDKSKEKKKCSNEIHFCTEKIKKRKAHDNFDEYDTYPKKGKHLHENVLSSKKKKKRSKEHKKSDVNDHVDVQEEKTLCSSSQTPVEFQTNETCIQGAGHVDSDQNFVKIKKRHKEKKKKCKDQDDNDLMSIIDTDSASVIKSVCSSSVGKSEVCMENKDINDDRKVKKSKKKYKMKEDKELMRSIDINSTPVIKSVCSSTVDESKVCRENKDTNHRKVSRHKKHKKHNRHKHNSHTNYFLENDTILDGYSFKTHVDTPSVSVHKDYIDSPIFKSTPFIQHVRPVGETLKHVNSSSSNQAFTRVKTSSLPGFSSSKLKQKKINSNEHFLSKGQQTIGSKTKKIQRSKIDSVSKFPSVDTSSSEDEQILQPSSSRTKKALKQSSNELASEPSLAAAYLRQPSGYTVSDKGYLNCHTLSQGIQDKLNKPYTSDSDSSISSENTEEKTKVSGIAMKNNSNEPVREFHLDALNVNDTKSDENKMHVKDGSTDPAQNAQLHKESSAMENFNTSSSSSCYESDDEPSDLLATKTNECKAGKTALTKSQPQTKSGVASTSGGNLSSKITQMAEMKQSSGDETETSSSSESESIESSMVSVSENNNNSVNQTSQTHSTTRTVSKERSHHPSLSSSNENDAGLNERRRGPKKAVFSRIPDNLQYLSKDEICDILHVDNTVHPESNPELSERLLELKKIKKGRWTPDEDRILKQNWAAYFELHPDPHPERFARPEDIGDLHEKRMICRQIKETFFWTNISRGILRTTYAVYLRCLHLFVEKNRKKGEWLPEEEQELLRLYKRYGNKFRKISEIMGRSAKACSNKFASKFSTDSECTKGKVPWEEDEDERLLESLRSMYGNIIPTAYHGIKWVNVAKQVKTRDPNQCRKRWMRFLGRDSTEIGSRQFKSRNSDKVKLIKSLLAQEIKHKEEINWEKVFMDFSRKVFPVQLQCMWMSLKRRYVTDYTDKTAEECLVCLKRILPQLEKAAANEFHDTAGEIINETSLL